jgi:hypothetical protein
LRIRIWDSVPFFPVSGMEKSGSEIHSHSGSATLIT